MKLAGGGVAGVRTPVCARGPTRLTLMRVQAVLKARSNLLGPTSAEEVILGYKRVEGGFGGASVGKEAAVRRPTSSISVSKYRPHRL
jgi:hypothetical protein